MNKRRFVALGDLIADCYYNGTKLLGIDGGSTRYNVLANLSFMFCKCAVIGGCGNDAIGQRVLNRLTELGVDTSSIFLRDRPARIYNLILDQSSKDRIAYICKKDSPQNGQITWYEDSVSDLPYCLSQIGEKDVVVMDNLDEFTLEAIKKLKCDKAIDIGNVKFFEGLDDSQLFGLKDQFEIMQLNERVVPYLLQRINSTNSDDVYKLFNPKLLIITRGKNGADFVFKDTVCCRKMYKSAKELDATGAGDAFLSVFLKKYYDNFKKLDIDFINRTFKEAVGLTSQVVQTAGARGHIYERIICKTDEEPDYNKD